MGGTSDSVTPGRFYSEMEQLLKQQLAAQPKLHTARLKLLEIYFETERRDDFLAEARLLSTGLDRKSHGVEWARVVSMGRMLELTDPIFQDSTADRIEFVGAATFTAVKAVKPERIIRFGEDDASKPFFKELADGYAQVRAEAQFLNEFDLELMHQASRPSALYHARRLSQEVGGAQIYFKREDLAPAATRLTINIIGQALLARRLGRTTLVTASVNGLKGVVAASVAARMGLRAIIFMDRDDLQRHSAHAFRMRLLGATVTEARRGRYPRGDVRYAALEAWIKRSAESFLLMGLDAAPHPYPLMAREFAAVIGRECRRQLVSRTKRPPDLVVARAGSNSDAIGFFDPFLADDAVRRVCVECGRELLEDGRIRDGENRFDPTRATLSDSEKRTASAILEGMEYPSVVREHAHLRGTGRVEYVNGATTAAKKAIVLLSRLEGIVPAIETAHVVAWVIEAARRMAPDQSVAMMLAETVDKDIWEMSRAMGELG